MGGVAYVSNGRRWQRKHYCGHPDSTYCRQCMVGGVSDVQLGKRVRIGTQHARQVAMLQEKSGRKDTRVKRVKHQLERYEGNV